MKCLRKQTNCAVLADFRDATFVQTGPNSGFLLDFFAQKGAFVQGFVRSIYFLGGLTGKSGAGTRNSGPRNSFFEARNFFFGARTKKSRYRNVFAAAPGGVFLSRWNFFPDTFPVSFCRRNPPAGFPASRTSAPGVSRAPSKGQVRRGFRDILIPIRRVWLRSFRAVPARRPNTRISDGEKEQIVNAHPKVHSVNGKKNKRGCIKINSSAL